MNQETKVIALPSTITLPLDDSVESWLLVKDDRRLAATLIRALALEGFLREHELITTRFLAKDLVPATRLAWGDEAMILLLDQLAKAGYPNDGVPPYLPREEALELPPLEVLLKHLPPDRPDLVPTEGSYWVEVAPRVGGGVSVELYTYDKHSGRRINAELPDELLERALRTTRFADVPPGIIGDVHATTGYYLEKWRDLLETPGLLEPVLSLMRRDGPDHYVFYDGPLHNVVVEVRPASNNFQVSAMSTTGYHTREGSFTPTAGMEVQK